jgi:hypothetical protein
MYLWDRNVDLVTIVLSVLIRLTASDYLLWYLQTFLRPLWNILRAWGDWIVESLIKTYINLCFIMSIYFLLKFLYQAPFIPYVKLIIVHNYLERHTCLCTAIKRIQMYIKITKKICMLQCLYKLILPVTYLTCVLCFLILELFGQCLFFICFLFY